MPEVDACKVLSDPRKIGRIYYVLEPLLEPPINFKAKIKRCEALLKDAKEEWAQNPYVVGALKLFRIINEKVFEKLDCFKKNNWEIIFITSESKSPSEGYVCTSIFSEQFTLADKILQMERSLYDEFGPSEKQIVYFPVAPVLLPAITSYETCETYNGKEEVILKFPFFEIFKEINQNLPDKQKIVYEDLTRRLNQDSVGRRGLYMFKTLLFDPASAKLVFKLDESESLESIKEQNRLLEDCTYVNRTLFGNAYKNICRKIGFGEDEEVPLFSEEGGYAAKIFEAGEIKISTFGQVTRNSNAKIYGTSSDSAINILKSIIHNVRYGELSFFR
jgi:hypothetical protein